VVHTNAVASRDGVPFVGRGEVLAKLVELLDAARSGRPQIALIHGPAGIGKTALLRNFLRPRDGVHSLWANGEALESLVEFGTADQLFRAVGSTCEPRGVATPDIGSGLFHVGMQLLECLADAASDAPLAVIVDDAHWADSASLNALAFALRRLISERVLIIFACREDWPTALPLALRRLLEDARCTRIELTGLGKSELMALGRELGRPLGSVAARRLGEHTGGNPLYAAAFLSETDPEVLAAFKTGALVGPPPAPTMYSSIVLARLGECGRQAQVLAQAAAVLGVRWNLAEAVRLAEVVSSRENTAMSGALDDLVDAGLVEFPAQAASPSFAHPLVQAAIYHDLAPIRRRTLHREAGRLASTTVESLHHRVAACLGRDAELAAEVADMASGQATHGFWPAAASAFLTAARLAHGVDAERFLLSGVECLLLGGDVAGAVAMKGRIEHCHAGARRDYVRSFLRVVSGDRVGGKTLLHQAWDRVAPSENDVAARIATQLALVALNEGRGLDAHEWGRRASETDPGLLDRGMARIAEVAGLGQMGRLDEALAAAGDLPLDSADFDISDLGGALGRAMSLLWSGRISHAHQVLLRVEGVARRLGSLSMRVIALHYLADAEYRLGYWDPASAHAELATSLADDAGEVWLAGLAHSVAAFPAAGRGEWDRARAHVAAAATATAALGDPANQVWLATAQARIAQSAGDDSGVLAATDALMSLDVPCGRALPDFQPWMLLRGEALARLGRQNEADDVVAEVAAIAATRPTSMLGLARVRGLIAVARHDNLGAERELQQALAAATATDVFRLDQALVELDLGSVLRRGGRRKAAAGHLRQARRFLAQLAAEPFIARCDRELAACGVAYVVGSDAFHAKLSPQEQAVATLAVTGLTNREIASKLVVSTKAIEFHLTNIFAKMGVRNRVELASKFPSSVGKSTDQIAKP
jgi:ATP/maltotriose-dependent transcriptional regulator MalT